MNAGDSTGYHESAASALVAVVFLGTEVDERQFADLVHGKLPEEDLAALCGDVGHEIGPAELKALQEFLERRP